MLHADEGTLHAFLDGELPALGLDPARLEAHLAGCGECRQRLEEVRQVYERATTLLREAAPPETAELPFTGILARAALSAPPEPTPPPEPGHDMSTAALDAGKPRFTHLVASGGQRKRSWSSRTVVVSVLAHAAILAGAVYASVIAPAVVTEKEEEKVSFVEIEEQKPEPVKAEEPPPPPPEQPQEAPPIPKGFQELVPPDEPPPEIPKVDLSAPAVTAADFSGIGVAGGKADGDPTVKEAPKEEPPPESQPGFAYEVAVLDSPPRLSNASQVQSTLQRLYPRMLQDAGIEGTVVMQFVITEKGEVEPSSVKVISSTHDQFASASEKAVERFRFRPGRYKGKDVRVLIQMPIAWKPQ